MYKVHSHLARFKPCWERFMLFIFWNFFYKIQFSTCLTSIDFWIFLNCSVIFWKIQKRLSRPYTHPKTSYGGVCRVFRLMWAFLTKFKQYEANDRFTLGFRVSRPNIDFWKWGLENKRPKNCSHIFIGELKTLTPLVLAKKWYGNDLRVNTSFLPKL